MENLILKENKLKDKALNNQLQMIALIIAARKSEIVRLTEQILDAINTGDFDSYTYVFLVI